MTSTPTRRWLVDKSAYARLPRSIDAEQWLDRIQRGLVSISIVTLLEVGFSAQSSTHWKNFQSTAPITLMPKMTLDETSESRALEVQGLLAERGYHRAASIPDLLIAAMAELADLTVLHVDKDFELIAEVTGQTVERLAGDF